MVKHHANKGLPRNKKKLKNIVYEIKVQPELNAKHVKPSDEEKHLAEFQKYKFKDEGYLFMHWWYENQQPRMFHGCITPEELKNLLGEKQWAKFCAGKREFIQQRRINGNNIPLQNNDLSSIEPLKPALSGFFFW